jgi:hypothetical protein
MITKQNLLTEEQKRGRALRTEKDGKAEKLHSKLKNSLWILPQLHSQLPRVRGEDKASTLRTVERLMVSK